MAIRKPTSASRPAGTPSRAASLNKAQPARKASLKPGTTRALEANDSLPPFFKKPRLLGKPSVSLKRAYELRENPFARNAFDVAVMSLKQVTDSTSEKKQFLPALKDFVMFRARTKTNKNGHVHNVVLWIETRANGSIDNMSKVCYMCDDKSHSFWGMEWHNSRPSYALSPLYYSNGAAPTVRRPGNNRPTACKHMLAVLRYIIGRKIVPIQDPKAAAAKKNDQTALKNPIGKRRSSK